jgi:type IV secretory pathway VirB3-like protein
MTSSASNVKILFWKMAAVFPMQGLVQVSVQSPGISVTILAVLYVVYIIIIRVFTKTFGSIGLSLQNEIMKSNNEFWKVPNSMV